MYAELLRVVQKAVLFFKQTSVPHHSCVGRSDFHFENGVNHHNCIGHKQPFSSFDQERTLTRSKKGTPRRRNHTVSCGTF